MAQIQIKEEAIANELANKAASVAAEELCDILADKAKMNEAIANLQCFNLTNVLAVAPNARDANFDWVKFIHSDQFKPEEHLVTDYLNVRIPSYMSDIQASLSGKDLELFGEAVGSTHLQQVRKAFMLYAACIEVDKNNYRNQPDFYVNLKLLASNAKDNGRKKEAEIFSNLSDSFQVIQKRNALKDKFEPIALLLQRASKDYQHLTTDQVRGIARSMLARIGEIKAYQTRVKSKFFKDPIIKKNLAIESLRALLQSENRQEMEAIVKTSSGAPSKRK